jgi:single-strand DNA-binding protein
MINKAVLVGRLTKDPELRYTSSNIAYTRFTVAVNRTYSEPNGERKADFISCVAWRNQAENTAKYVRKGSLVGIEGRIQTGSYEDNSGVRRYTTDIVCDNVQFLEPKSANEQQGSGYKQDDGFNNDYRQDYEDRSNQKRQNTPSIDVSEDDLPF